MNYDCRLVRCKLQSLTGASNIIQVGRRLLITRINSKFSEWDQIFHGVRYHVPGASNTLVVSEFACKISRFVIMEETDIKFCVQASLKIFLKTLCFCFTVSFNTNFRFKRENWSLGALSFVLNILHVVSGYLQSRACCLHRDPPSFLAHRPINPPETWWQTTSLSARKLEKSSQTIIQFIESVIKISR